MGAEIGSPTRPPDGGRTWWSSPPVHRFPVLPAPARLVFGAHARRLDRRLAAVAAELPATHHLPVGDIPVDEPGLFAADGFHPAPPAYRIRGRLLAGQAAPLLAE